MKLCGSKFLQKNLIASGKNCFSGKCETVFSIYQKFQAAKTVSPKKETFFLPTSSFRQGETNFLSSRSKYPGKHLLVLKTSSTRLQRNNFTSCKTSWRRLEDMSWRRLQNTMERKKILTGDLTNLNVYLTNLCLQTYIRQFQVEFRMH